MATATVIELELNKRIEAESSWIAGTNTSTQPATRPGRISGNVTWRIVVPQMSSGIAALAAIVMLAVWGEFLIPLLLTSTLNSKTVTVVIPEFVGKYTTNYPLLAAAGVLAVLPPAIVALVLNRYIRGMLHGSS